MEITDLNNKIKIYTRFHSGHWCGYIDIPEGHPIYNMATGDCYEGSDAYLLDSGDREINYSNFNNGFLTLGFDCGHLSDTKKTNTEDYAMKCLEAMKKDAIRKGLNFVTIVYKNGKEAIVNDMEDKLNDCVRKIIGSINTQDFVKECFGDDLHHHCLNDLSATVRNRLFIKNF